MISSLVVNKVVFPQALI